MKTIKILTKMSPRTYGIIELEEIENPDDPRFSVDRDIKNGHPDFWVWYADGKEHRYKGITYPCIILRGLRDLFTQEGRDKFGYRKYRYRNYDITRTEAKRLRDSGFKNPWE